MKERLKQILVLIAILFNILVFINILSFDFWRISIVLVVISGILLNDTKLKKQYNTHQLSFYLFFIWVISVVATYIQHIY